MSLFERPRPEPNVRHRTHGTSSRGRSLRGTRLLRDPRPAARQHPQLRGAANHRARGRAAAAAVPGHPRLAWTRGPSPRARELAEIAKGQHQGAHHLQAHMHLRVEKRTCKRCLHQWLQHDRQVACLRRHCLSRDAPGTICQLDQCACDVVAGANEEALDVRKSRAVDEEGGSSPLVIVTSARRARAPPALRRRRGFSHQKALECSKASDRSGAPCWATQILPYLQPRPPHGASRDRTGDLLLAKQHRIKPWPVASGARRPVASA